MMEQALQRALFAEKSEKTFIDKVLAKSDIDHIRKLIIKPKLTRSDTLELLYMLSSTESKLANYGAWDRYIILKFYVWIRSFTWVTEINYDYREQLEKTQAETGRQMTARTTMYFNEIERMMEHNVKFLADLYLNITRTTLSLGGTGFLEALRNKFELNYSGNVPGAYPQPQQGKPTVRTSK